MSAIGNAKLNCVQNGIQNCEFFDGKAEDILPSVIHKSKHDDIIAIVDPPRAGLREYFVFFEETRYPFGKEGSESFN